MTWENRWLRRTVVFGVVTLCGILLAMQSHALYSKDKEPFGWGAAFAWSLSWCYLWLAFSPVVLRLAKKYPLVREGAIRNLRIHIPACLAITVLHTVLLSAAAWAILMRSKPPMLILEMVRDRFAEGDYVLGVFIYCILLGAHQSLDLYRQYRERKVRATQLETQLTQAQLQTLKMQLQPEFLFHTLRSITQLMRKDVEAADKMIARLGDFLRLTLENAEVEEISFQRELDLLKLEIEQIPQQRGVS